MAWYHPGFAFKKAIIIPSAKVSGGSDLPDFPVLVLVNSSDLKTMIYGGLVATSIGLDILFTDGNEQRELAYEIESFVPSTGELLAWIRVPLLSVSQDTTIWLYFGNPTITLPLSNAIGTWDVYYSSVWHLGDSVTLNARDSITANYASSNTALVTSGVISGGASFTGLQTIQSLNTGGLDFTTGDTITLSVWAKRSHTGIWQTLVAHGSGTGRDYQLAFSGGSSYVGSSTGSSVDDLVFLYRDSGDTTWHCYASNATYTDTANWHHYGLTYTYGLPSSAVLYVDGQAVSGSWANGTGDVAPFAAFDNIAIGSTTDIADGFYGILDEAHISKGVRHAAGWIATEHANQLNPSAFCSVGETILFEGNVDIPLIVAYGATMAQISSLQCIPHARGVRLVLTATSLQGDNPLTVTLLGTDTPSEQTLVLASWTTIGQITGQALGITVWTYYPGIESSSTVTSQNLPLYWQVNVTPTTNEPASYALSASVIR